MQFIINQRKISNLTHKMNLNTVRVDCLCRFTVTTVGVGHYTDCTGKGLALFIDRNSY